MHESIYTCVIWTKQHILCHNSDLSLELIAIFLSFCFALCFCLCFSMLVSWLWLVSNHMNVINIHHMNHLKITLVICALKELLIWITRTVAGQNWWYLCVEGCNAFASKIHAVLYYMYYLYCRYVPLRNYQYMNGIFLSWARLLNLNCFSWSSWLSKITIHVFLPDEILKVSCIVCRFFVEFCLINYFLF